MNKLFKRTTNLIELTKLLERETCDTLIVSKYLGNKVYPDLAQIAQGEITSVSHNWKPSFKIKFNRPYFTAIYQNTNCNLMLIYDKSDNNGVSYSFNDNKLSADKTKITIISPSGETKVIKLKTEETNYLQVFNQVGLFTLVYYFEVSTLPAHAYKEYTFKINVLKADSEERPQPTITSVLERLLSVYTARKVGTPQKYRLDPEIADRFRNTPSPEFAFTRCTLFEALRQVGGFIHGFPRLKWDEATDTPSIVTFDLFGTMGEWKPKRSIREIGSCVTWDAGDYCGQIESYVENFVNTKDQAAGVLTEPWDEFYKTMRTEQTQVRISNDTVLLETEFPIYQLVKLEMGYIDDNTIVGDITKFVYETSEYQNLSKYTDNYPNSVAYALQYTQGGTTISGFQAKEQEKPIFEALQKPTIENILKKLGYTLPSGLYYKDLAFRITYIPVVAARVIQRKTSLNAPQKENNTLFYNQGANLVENNYYGQNMKGAIARMGQKVLLNTYIFDRYEDIPKIGMKHTINGREYYISRINKEWERYHVKATIFFTEDYNMLSQFVGINSNYRLYDVSERQSYDRTINLSENIIIGSSVDNRQTSLSDSALSAYLNFLCDAEATVNSNRRTTCAYIKTMNKNGETIAEIIKSAASFACGNSIVFTWKMPDHFTAGGKSVYYDAAQNVQQLLQYGNVYGEFYQMQVEFFDSALKNTNNRPTAANVKQPTFSDQVSTAETAAVEDILPEVQSAEFAKRGWKLSETPNAEMTLIVQKDSREVIGLTYQAHTKVTRDSIVIGKLFAENSPLIKEVEGILKPQIAFFTQPLDRLQGNAYIETIKTGAKAKGVINGSKFIIEPIKNTTSETYRAWGLVDPETQELYIGENMELPPNAETLPIVFNF